MDPTTAQQILSWSLADDWEWINVTCKELGQKSLKLMGMHYLTGSDYFMLLLVVGGMKIVSKKYSNIK